MSFKDKLEETNKSQPSDWKLIEIIGDIDKNKTDFIRVVRTSNKGREFIQAKVWRLNTDDGKIFPLTGNSITCSADVAKELGELLSGIE